MTLKEFETGKIPTHRISTNSWLQKGIPMEAETVYPMGKYSLCPVLFATNVYNG